MKNSFVHRVVGFSIKRPFVVIFLTVALSVVLGYFAMHVQLDADVMNMLPSNYEVMKLTERFGRSDDSGQLLIAVESADLYSLEKLQAFEAGIERVRGASVVLGSITPFNLVTFEREGRRLMPVTMAPEGRAPRTQEELELFHRRLTGDPLARNLVLSGDGTTLCAVFPVELRQDYSSLLALADEVATELGGYFDVHVAGAPVILQTTKNALLEDVPKFLILGAAVILAILFLSFRTLRSVALPMIVVGLGTLWTIGTMRILGYSLTVISIMVPPLVLTLGSSYSIHILNQYYREVKVHAGDNEWIAHSVGQINLTIFLAALTTIIGFSSLATATLRQVREFGLSTSIGIFYCAILSLVFFPAVLSLLKPPRERDRDRVLKGHITRFMEHLGYWVIRRRWFIVGVVVVIVVGFGVSLRYVRYQTNYMAYFRASERLIQDSDYVIRKFGGYTNVFMTVEAPGGQSGYFLRPEVLRKLEAFEQDLRDDPDVSYVFSFTQYLRLMNLRLTGSFTVPESRAPILLLSRYMRAITGSAYGQSMEIEPINEDFTRMTISFRAFDSRTGSMILEPEYRKLLARVDGLVDTRLSSFDPPPVLWGRSLALLYISETLSRDQLYSVLVSLLLIFLVTAVGFRSARLGLLTLLPMLTGIMLNFIIMVVLHIPFDVVTVMFTSVAIGVGIDDSIHLIIRYRRQTRIYQEGEVEISKVLAHTLKTGGRPILVTSLSLITGLLVLTFSRFLPILYFGLLVSLALFTTTIGALIVLPAVLSLMSPYRRRRREAGAAAPANSAASPTTE
jgi:hydrophobe/amphiphile efflux-3 (HAE3) family protein